MSKCFVCEREFQPGDPYCILSERYQIVVCPACDVETFHDRHVVIRHPDGRQTVNGEPLYAAMKRDALPIRQWPEKGGE